MASERLLEGVWTAYLITKDALTVSQRASLGRQRDLFTNLDVLRSAPTAAVSALAAARERADEFVILAMWAEFERYLIAFLEARTNAVRSRPPRRLWKKLAPHIAQGIERWRSDERLDVLKDLVDPQRVGEAKQVKLFRDWVAHKNPRRLPPAAVLPDSTYRLLSEIMAALDAA